ncbi:hypothetical protein IWQ54_002461 [Labrenzia sp. EL_195]|nr:hypothetical protein [Labrenzia sp. EL_195]
MAEWRREWGVRRCGYENRTPLIHPGLLTAEQVKIAAVNHGEAVLHKP